MILSAEERLNLTSVKQVKSYCILGMSDHILVIRDNQLIILFIISISSIIRCYFQHKFQIL